MSPVCKLVARSDVVLPEFCTSTVAAGRRVTTLLHLFWRTTKARMSRLYFFCAKAIRTQFWTTRVAALVTVV